MKEIRRPNSITVVFASDNNYAMPLAVTICSILKNLNAERYLDAYVLDGGISQKNKDKLLKSIDLTRCSITWLDTKGKFNDAVTYAHINETTYHRILIPELLSNNIHKAIYLDCDLVVLSDLSQLWDLEIDDNYIQAVQDYNWPQISIGIRNYKELGIPPTNMYFNAGVLVINLDKWRKDKTAEQLIEYIFRPRDFAIFQDQEALNVILWDKWQALDSAWNYQVRPGAEFPEYISSLSKVFGEEEYKVISANPKIIHFITDAKPWQYYRHPYKEVFYQYVDITAWSGWRYSKWKVLLRKLKNFFKL